MQEQLPIWVRIDAGLGGEDGLAVMEKVVLPKKTCATSVEQKTLSCRGETSIRQKKYKYPMKKLGSKITFEGNCTFDESTGEIFAPYDKSKLNEKHL